MEFITEVQQTAVCGDYDVIVVGGGVAGVSAALSAARNGAKVLLIEKTTVLGGLATAGLVILYFPLDDGCGHKVIGGVSEELLHASIKYGYDNLPAAWKDGPMTADTKERYQTLFNAPAFALAIDELIQEAGIDLLLDTVFCDVVMEDGLCKAVIVENKSGRQAYRCKAVVDSTGDADVMFHAGIPCEQQENTLAYWAYCRTETNDCIFRPGGGPPDYVKVMALGLADGRNLPEGLCRFYGISVEEVTRALVTGRRLALEKIKQPPDLVYTSFPTQVQFRTTRRLVGEHTLKPEDVFKSFPDSIGCTGLTGPNGDVFEFPLGMLYNRAVRNAFAAGRNVSGENGRGWHIIRGIPTCAMTGQAAGTAAMLFAKDGAVDIGVLQKTIEKDKGIIHIPEEIRAQHGA